MTQSRAIGCSVAQVDHFSKTLRDYCQRYFRKNPIT